LAVVISTGSVFSVAISIAAWSSLVLNDPLRRLPEIPRTRTRFSALMGPFLASKHRIGSDQMDLNNVAVFVRVVEEGSFTAAARALGAPKSSVSRGVSQLEQDLGVRLLHRTTRKLHLTDAGVAFHKRVSQALSDIREATSRTADLQREIRGEIRLTAPVD